jgi:hypothetical protein
LFLIKIAPKGDVQSCFILGWFGILLILFIPCSIISYLFYGKLKLGRLGVVYDQAGKARVVGITNYFVQIFLNPYHTEIFDILSTIEQDGTHDQYKPLDLLFGYKPFEPVNNDMYFSFDLSAATDRLPLDIQSLVLNLLKPGLGDN